MRVLLTGAAGFLGWHTRVRLCAVGQHEVIPVTRSNWGDLCNLIATVDAVIHVAGVNRGLPADVENGNVALAQGLAAAMTWATRKPRIVFANSIQSGTDSPYGAGKGKASDILESAATRHGLSYVDVRLPNLYGEHGRPHYNSFVATFVKALIRCETPEIIDKPITLLHAQQAAQWLLDALGTKNVPRLDPMGTPTSVREVFDRLSLFHKLYAFGDIPPLNADLDVDLFNTLRSALFPHQYPIRLITRADHRGSLVEVVRAHGGQGQTFASTTQPGSTRGEHFHIRKVERFAVLAGRGRIQLRRLFDDKIVSFELSGEQPGVIDMPTMWAHKITNVGDQELTTLFWTHELFNPEMPDTYPEPV